MKTTTENKQPEWAVVQLGYAIFGDGDTRQEALEDASEWVEINGRQGGGDASDVENMLAHSYTHLHGIFEGDMICTNDPDIISEYWKP